MQHVELEEQVRKVNVERLVAARIHEESLSVEELQVLGMHGNAMELPAPEQLEEGQQFSISSILVHREYDGGRQFLVEWERGMDREGRLASWVDEKDVQALEKINEYFARLARGVQYLEVIHGNKRRCRGNGDDSGCYHLPCRYKLWKVAYDKLVEMHKKIR